MDGALQVIKSAVCRPAWLASLLLLATPALATAARAQAQAAPAYAVTYLEIAPRNWDKAARLLTAWAKGVRQKPEALGVATLQSRSPDHQVAIMQIWKDQASYDAERASPRSMRMREALEPLLTAPFDERPQTPLAANAARSALALTVKATGVIYVITHVDIIPPRQQEGIAATKALFPPASKEVGNLSFDVLQQASRPNHLSLFEVWTGERSLDGHTGQGYVEQYRTSLLPMSGSLYDRRTYKLIW